jgi:hypothetical protein
MKQQLQFHLKKSALTALILMLMHLKIKIKFFFYFYQDFIIEVYVIVKFIVENFFFIY